jgi:hypothetical protein
MDGMTKEHPKKGGRRTTREWMKGVMDKVGVGREGVHSSSVEAASGTGLSRWLKVGAKVVGLGDRLSFIIVEL